MLYIGYSGISIRIIILKIHEMVYSHFRQISIFPSISNSIYLCLYLSMSVYIRSNPFWIAREVLSLFIYLPASSLACDIMKIGSILRTMLEEGTFGMYLLLHPFPHSWGYHKQKTVF
jgi:hypothetical protein